MVFCRRQACVEIRGGDFNTLKFWGVLRCAAELRDDGVGARGVVEPPVRSTIRNRPRGGRVAQICRVRLDFGIIGIRE